ncbi:MAG TPA: DUF1289 domain-containing protein [Steroidobacter sp.]|nr:DUF1289 domain-containing protein [Steroidobacter sp.]
MTPASDPPQRVESPCIKLCRLDEHNVCVGCGRTLAEIARWSRMSAEQQLATHARAAARINRRRAARRS